MATNHRQSGFTSRVAVTPTLQQAVLLHGLDGGATANAVDAGFHKDGVHANVVVEKTARRDTGRQIDYTAREG